MAARQKARWLCPECGGGVLAPRAPRRDDVRRYCLACSAATGRLVQRVAPALERRRAQRQESRTAKRRAEQQRAREREAAAYTVAGVDLRDEMRRLMRLPCWRRKFDRDGAPELRVRRCSSYPRTRLGWADPYAWKISIAAYPGQDAADVRETLIHELCHLAVGYQRGSRHWHGTAFKAGLRQAVTEAYGVIYPAGPVYHGRVAAALRQAEAAGGGRQP